ncbi:MAG: hypothetical protein JSW66_13445 [Phycisphaerales bacterium]|nr:MAG: hypothetical protein JSW66_13445 [Phycisphaerales bacterium]
MKDRDIDTHLTQYLPGDPPREAFKQQALRDSTAEFNRVSRRRSAWRRAELAAAAVLIAGVAFLSGRLSAPPALPMSADVAPPVAAEPDGVSVPSELVSWLEAARLFRQLGMEDRMARAVERAGRLLPYDASIASSVMGPVFAAARPAESQTERVKLMGISGPHPSAKSINQILAQSFGD